MFDVVMRVAPNFLVIIKYLGAFYLIYLGVKTFMQKPILDVAASVPITRWQALRNGFFTNALNPKTTLFVISTYTQIVSAATPKFVLIGYGAFMSLVHFAWFALVALLFSQKRLRMKMLSKQVSINRVIGIVLAILGLLLLFSNIH